MPDPALPRSRILVNGVEIGPDVRPGEVRPSKLLLHNLDGPDEFEFLEVRAEATQRYPDGSRVTVDLAFDTDEDGTLVEGDWVRRFNGVILRAAKSQVVGGRRVDYQCAGLAYLADEVAVSHPQSGKPEIAFNLPPTDRLYEEEQARLPIGEMIRRTLTYDQHATELWQAGITAYTADPPLIDPLDPSKGRRYNTADGSPAVLRAQTLADLAAMDLIPYKPVRFSGTKLWQQVRNAIEDNVPYIGCEILPDGLIRFHDTRTPNLVGLRLGTHPLELPSISRDAGQTYGAIQILGDDEVEGKSFDTAVATLLIDWTAQQQAEWKFSDFEDSTGAESDGTIVPGTLGATTLEVRPVGGVTAWAASKWASDRAVIELVLPVGPNNPSELTEIRRVVGNTACVAGGTATISLEYALSTSGFAHYRLKGQSTNPRRNVWRKYRFADPAIASRIVDQFPYEVWWQFLQGGQYVSTPVGKNFRKDTPTSNERVGDLYFDLITDSDGVRKVLCSAPTCEIWSTKAELATGGSAVKAPSRILVFVPVSRGALSLREPASGWEGAAATNPYMRRVKRVSMPDWKFKGDATRMRQYARSLLEVHKDPVQAGSLTHFGLWREGVETPNAAVNLTSDFGDTPWQGEKLLVRGVEVVWTGGAAKAHTTRVNVSNQRRPFAGESQFTPAAWVEGGPLSGGRW